MEWEGGGLALGQKVTVNLQVGIKLHIPPSE